MNTNLIEILKIELDYRSNKTENIIYLRNKTKDNLFLIIENKYYLSNDSTIITINFNLHNFNLKIFKINKLYNHYLLDTIKFNFSNWKINGIGGNSLIETPNGKLNLQNIDYTKNNTIYDSLLNKILIKCIIIYKIDNNTTTNNNIFPITIYKNNFGLNLPNSDFDITINENLRVKKFIMSGRQIFLNTIFNNDYYIYNIITENVSSMLVNGFILDSLNVNILNC